MSWIADYIDARAVHDQERVLELIRACPNHESWEMAVEWEVHGGDARATTESTEAVKRPGSESALST